METNQQPKPRYRVQFISAKELLRRFIFEGSQYRYIDYFKKAHCAKIYRHSIDFDHTYQFITKIN